MLNVNVMQSIARMGRRLAEAGREARATTASVAGAAAEQVTEVLGAAVAEIVRTAVIGAVVAVVKGGTAMTTARPPVPVTLDDPWYDDDRLTGEYQLLDAPTPEAPPADKPAWARTTRAVGSALSVAAGAAAAVPGGKLVAAGLGGLAAVAGLAARAAEPKSE